MDLNEPTVIEDAAGVHRKREEEMSTPEPKPDEPQAVVTGDGGPPPICRRSCDATAGYHKIPAEAWRAYDAQLAAAQARLRRLHKPAGDR